MTKILLLNPNTSESVTRLIDQEARRAALDTTEIVTENVQMGVAYIETPAEAVVASYAAFEHLARHGRGYDGIVIAAFGDPGVAQAKEILPVPVIGLTEAALANAFLLGGRFGIVGISKRIGYWYEDTIKNLGMTDRFAGYNGLGQAFANVGTVHQSARAMLLDMCLDQVSQGADTIILAGAPLAGLARDIADQVPVPLVDGVGSAVRMLEALIRAQFRPRQTGPLSPPPEKQHKGLSNDLSRLIGRA